MEFSRATGDADRTMRGERPRSPRPLSRIVSSSSSPDMQHSRLSRSQTMMSPGGNFSSRPIAPISQHQPRSPTHSGHFSPKYSPRRTHGSIDNSDFPSSGSSSNVQTLSPLQRSQTTRLGPGVYGKNMWDENEYVDTGGNASPRTPTGGPAARRINQQRRMQVQTVKLPKNPFVDTDDYADMTGHQRDETGMEELRNAHEYKSLKIRSHSTNRYPFEQDHDGVTKESSEVDLTSRDRNVSVSSSRSGSQTSRFKRSDTSPVFTSQRSLKEKHGENVQRNGSLREIQLPVEEVDGIENPVPSNKGTLTSNIANPTMSTERQDSITRPATINSGGLTITTQLPVPSPAHSGASGETTTTFLQHSEPASPAVVYKSSNGGATDAQVAIVVEHTIPTSPRYATFANREDSQKSNNTTNLHDSRSLKFDSSTKKSKAGIVIPILLAILLVIGLIAACAVLVSMVVQQKNKIKELEQQIAAFEITTTMTLVSTPITAEEETTAAVSSPTTIEASAEEQQTTGHESGKIATATNSAVVISTGSINSGSTEAKKSVVTELPSEVPVSNTEATTANVSTS